MATWKIVEIRGRWCLEFEDGAGRRRREVARDKRGRNSRQIAEAMLRHRYMEVATGGYIAPRNAIRFSELAERFLAAKRPEVRALTLRDYESIFRRRLNKFFGHVRLSQISRFDVERFRAHELERGQGWRTTTKTLVLLGTVFRFARAHGWMNSDPTEGIRKIARPQAHEEELDSNVLAPEEARALLAAAERRATAARIAQSARPARSPDTVPQRRLDHSAACYFAVVACAMLAGLRQSELLALTWGQVDLDGRELRVVARFRKGETGEPKSGSSRRRVPMPDALVRILRAWKLASAFKADDALVFCTSAGGHENYSNVIKRGLRPALVDAGITRLIRLHDLRHTYASSLIRAGVDILRVARMLGHASPDITLRVYGHLIRQGRDDAAEKLEQLMLGGACNNLVTTPSVIGGSTNQSSVKSLNILVPEIGIEPTTRALRMRCSTN